MPATYSDGEIAALIEEPKHLPRNWRELLQHRFKRGHEESDLHLTGESGNEFRIILRRSTINTLDFSLILAVLDTVSGDLFRLRRYDGKSHEHTNRIEDEAFYDFHIHTATERYQATGDREDAYAEATNRYDDFDSALGCLLSDGGFVVPTDG